MLAKTAFARACVRLVRLSGARSAVVVCGHNDHCTVGGRMTASRSAAATRSAVLRIRIGLTALGVALVSCASSGPVRTEIAGSPCMAQPRYECPDAKNCDANARTFLGAATETKSGRKFFLDYACDL